MRQINVLLVDDDADARQELRTLLTGMGHSIVGETDSGAKALTLARTLRPDLILLEVALTQGSALDTAETLAAEWLAPILLVTGDAEAATQAIARAGRSGAMAFLAKPLRPADLGPGIQFILARWHHLAELNSEIRSLNERIEARKLVGRAKAILMERFHLQERDAFKRIQAQSVAMNKPVHEIARAIITAHDVSG